MKGGLTPASNFSLSEKYAEWADYRAPAKGLGIHAYAHEVSQPIRLTDQELRAHERWRNFGDEIEKHPPMRGWLAVPLIGSDGANSRLSRVRMPVVRSRTVVSVVLFSIK